MFYMQINEHIQKVIKTFCCLRWLYVSTMDHGHAHFPVERELLN